MQIKVNPATLPQQVEATQRAEESSGQFKFTLASRLDEATLSERMTAMMEEISLQGEKLKKKRDIRDMKRYRALIKDFMNEVVTRSHDFARENFLDRRGRHRVYGIIRLVDQKLDDLAQALLADEKDDIEILSKIGEIEGLILDLFT
ncbi:MAG: YaaR family protein [Lachnospiraceae bacterium]|nr:YaaR family protein [Lachnospiraceae bacterium]